MWQGVFLCLVHKQLDAFTDGVFPSYCDKLPLAGYTGFINRNSKVVLLISSPGPVNKNRREKQILTESEQSED